MCDTDTNTLYLIGLGLGDAKDITVRGLEIVKRIGKVYLENYTSILCCNHEELEKFYERPIELVDREMMEQGCKTILDAAETGGAAVLVVGDPLNATTHTDLLLRAANRKIQYRIIHNASILNAVACCGLQIYNFGETVSIPFWTDNWKPESYYDKILRNKDNNLHTLCLLDIKVREPNLELLVKGINQMDPPRFMTFSQAAEQLLSIIRKRKVDMKTGVSFESATEAADMPVRLPDLDETCVCIGLARVGSESQRIVKTTLFEATTIDLGGPLHSLVIPGSMHPLEEEMIALFSESQNSESLAQVSS